MYTWENADWEIAYNLPVSLRAGATSGARSLFEPCVRAYRFAAQLVQVDTDLYRTLDNWREMDAISLYPVYYRMARYFDTSVDDYQLELPLHEHAFEFTPEMIKETKWWGWFHSEASRLQESVGFIRAICEVTAFYNTSRSNAPAEYLRGMLDGEYEPRTR